MYGLWRRPCVRCAERTRWGTTPPVRGRIGATATRPLCSRALHFYSPPLVTALDRGLPVLCLLCAHVARVVSAHLRRGIWRRGAGADDPAGGDWPRARIELAARLQVPQLHLSRCAALSRFRAAGRHTLHLPPHPSWPLQAVTFCACACSLASLGDRARPGAHDRAHHAAAPPNGRDLA